MKWSINSYQNKTKNNLVEPNSLRKMKIDEIVTWIGQKVIAFFPNRY